MPRLTTFANIGLIGLLTGLLIACAAEDDTHSSAATDPNGQPRQHSQLPPTTTPETATSQVPKRRQIPVFEPSPNRDEARLPQVAIIIDDIGYHLQFGLEAARLPGPLTLAVLPHSPNGVALAELGHEQGKEIILHNPMSTIAPRQLDPGGLTEAMVQQEFEAVLKDNLASIPHISGLNNHMGSRLTQQTQPMQWLMQTLARENLFFIDSRTSAQSVALAIARQAQIPSRKRDIFLDNERTPAAIARQFEQLIHIAMTEGSAIGIGHPYPETLAFLLQVMPQATQLGIELVPVSQLLPTYTASLEKPPHKLQKEI